MNLQPLKLAKACYAFFFGHAVDCIRIVWLPLLLPAAGYQTIRAVQPFSGTPSSLGDWTVHQLWTIASSLPMAIFVSIATAGMLRWLIRGAKPRRVAYLQLGLDELRLMAVALIVTCVWWLPSSALELWLLALSPNTVPLISLATLLTSIVFCTWVSVRISLTPQATFADKQISLAWRVSRGHGGGLFVFWLLAAGPLGLATILLSHFVLPDYHAVSAAKHLHDATALLNAWSDYFLATQGRAIPLTLLEFAGSLVQVPITAIAGVFAYRQLSSASRESTNDAPPGEA